jgi:hypothetical protein
MPQAVESRLNILVRLLGVIFLIFGMVLAALTASSPIIPQVSPLFYFISIIMVVSGLLAVVAKLK